MSVFLVTQFSSCYFGHSVFGFFFRSLSFLPIFSITQFSACFLGYSVFCFFSLTQSSFWFFGQSVVCLFFSVTQFTACCFGHSVYCLFFLSLSFLPVFSVSQFSACFFGHSVFCQPSVHQSTVSVSLPLSLSGVESLVFNEHAWVEMSEEGSISCLRIQYCNKHVCIYDSHTRSALI